MIRIEFAPINLANQTIVESRECFIELHEKYLRYRIEFFADEYKDDDDRILGEETIYNNFDIIALKQHIAGLRKSFTLDKKWAVQISVSGFATDINIYSKKQSTAQEQFGILQDWLLK